MIPPIVGDEGFADTTHYHWLTCLRQAMVVEGNKIY